MGCWIAYQKPYIVYIRVVPNHLFPYQAVYCPFIDDRLPSQAVYFPQLLMKSRICWPVWLGSVFFHIFRGKPVNVVSAQQLGLPPW
jgi:hypothetical protein